MGVVVMRRLLGAVVVTIGVLCSPPVPPAPAAQQLGPITVMPLGDSYTSGHGSTCGDGYRADFGYRLVITGGVGANYVGSKTSGCSANPRYEGGAGLGISQITAGINGGWMTQVPNLTLLYIGVNDARNGRTASQMLGDMSTLLDTILARSSANRVVVAKLIVPNGITPQLRSASITVQAFNDSLHSLAIGKGERVSVADMSIIPTGSLGSDGLHPTNAGYVQMSYIWYRSLAYWYGTGGYLPWSEVPFPVVPAL